MERKFASKLSQLKPAAEARKQASSQLKENILSVSVLSLIKRYSLRNKFTLRDFLSTTTKKRKKT